MRRWRVFKKSIVVNNAQMNNNNVQCRNGAEKNHVLKGFLRHLYRFFE